MNHNKAPKIGSKVIKSVVVGGIALALAAGSRQEGRSAQLKADRDDIAAARIQGKQEVADKLLGHTKPLERFKWLESQSAESVKKLKSNQLSENGAKVQASVLAISSELDISGQEVFERLVPEDARSAYSQRNVLFLFVEDDPTNPDCLNSFYIDDKNGHFEVGFFPLDASPDNLHPDNDPRT